MQFQSGALAAFLVTSIGLAYTVEDGTPLIIWWYESIFPHIEEDGKKIYPVNCGHENLCHATRSRDYVRDTDSFKVIVFYGSDFTPDDVPLPRLKHQMWALLHEESPQNNFILCQEELLQLFNFSSTFKQKSDFPLTMQHIPSIEHLYEKRPTSIEDKNRFRKDGYACTIYVQSHCDVPSDRDRYVAELMKYLQIDSYGECLRNRNFSDARMEGIASMQSKELLALLSKYKFHLTFENAICDDYVTEKVYRALHVGSVPVYMGASNIRHWVPTGSIIEVAEFNSPEELAKYLILLDNDDELYSQYLSYKEEKTSMPKYMRKMLQNRSWSTTNLLLPHFVNAYECFICREMHTIMEKMVRGIWLNPRVVNKSHLDCPPPSPSLKNSAIDKSDRFHAWVEDYRQAFYQAKAVTELIEEKESDPTKVWDRVGDLMMAKLRRHDEF